MKRSKKYNEVAAKVIKDHLYTPLQAVTLAKETTTTKYDSTIDVALVLGVDPKKADQAIRSTVNLPHGTGKTARVLVFANGERAEEARAAGADFVGLDDYIQKIEKGWTDIDVIITMPTVMAKVGRLGKVLGPRGLMPNPKSGTVTLDVGKAVTEVKAGKIDFKVDKTGIIHASIGKVSFSPENLVENAMELISVLSRLKPSSSKGTYFKSIHVSSTMSTGVKIDKTTVPGI